MSEEKLAPDSARAKRSRSKRLGQGYTRFDCLLNPQTSKNAKRIIRVRGFGNKTEMLDMLINEENIRLRKRTDGEGTDE